MNNSRTMHVDLQAMAQQVMLEHGFEPEFPAAAQQQLAAIQAQPPMTAGSAVPSRGTPIGPAQTRISRPIR